MTAFIVPSETSFQRVGVTASKKAIGNSAKRSRAKRLLRESFRLNSEALARLVTNYDWALNARREILKSKSPAVVEEFREIVEKVYDREQNPQN